MPRWSTRTCLACESYHVLVSLGRNNQNCGDYFKEPALGNHDLKMNALSLNDSRLWILLDKLNTTISATGNVTAIITDLTENNV